MFVGKISNDSKVMAFTRKHTEDDADDNNDGKGNRLTNKRDHIALAPCSYVVTCA